MYGKFRRGGGGRGGAKRNSFLPPPSQRPPTSSSRLSLPSNKPSSTPPLPPQSQPPCDSDESFSLISGEPLSFASIIRLAPDLVDEIKRVESQGGAVRVKFDSNPNNSSGNIIDVGGKEFRFTWSHEMGGLCDIYEERQNGLLVESGCSLRKLNVQRVLDESTKKKVKKRSEEYEQKQKSRKAIVLDQHSPSMKKQREAVAVVEENPLKFKSKTNRYIEPPQAKARCSNSALLSPKNQPVSLASDSVRGNGIESQTVLKKSTTIQGIAKENVGGSENLRNVLVTLLKENAAGMSLKALKKAVGDMSSYSTHKIEPILKKIATYEHPGRYILKSGIELESWKRSYFDSISSLEDNNEKQFVEQDNHGKLPAENLVENLQKVDESNTVKDFDASQHFSVLFGKHDSVSDTHSGCNSASRSRTKTRAKSGSASSSDGGDSFTNNKEAYDVDVDLMSDDEKQKQPKKLLGTENQPTCRIVINEQEYVEDEIQNEHLKRFKPNVAQSSRYRGSRTLGSPLTHLSHGFNEVNRVNEVKRAQKGFNSFGFGKSGSESLLSVLSHCARFLSIETMDEPVMGSEHEASSQGIGSHKGKGNKSRKSDGSKDASDRKRDGCEFQGHKEKRKRSELCSDENFSLLKYGKEEPKLKESIKSFSQYKDYVKEYHEKYESYCSLHKSLETYKNEFQKLGMDLYNAKARDKERYYDILAQLRESYTQRGMRHKQSKKIFIVLHQELEHLKQMIKDFATDYTRKSI